MLYLLHLPRYVWYSIVYNIQVNDQYVAYCICSIIMSLNGLDGDII